MIPLWIFLLIWLIFMGLFSLMSCISVVQMMRYGIRTSGTYLITSIFVITTVITISGSGIFFLNTDWSQEVNIFEGWTSSTLFNPNP